MKKVINCSQTRIQECQMTTYFYFYSENFFLLSQRQTIRSSIEENQPIKAPALSLKMQRSVHRMGEIVCNKWGLALMVSSRHYRHSIQKVYPTFG